MADSVPAGSPSASTRSASAQGLAGPPADPDAFALSMGPAGNQFCCGKPFGCTNASVGCSFLLHRWKLDNIPGHREAMEARQAERAAQAEQDGN